MSVLGYKCCHGKNESQVTALYNTNLEYCNWQPFWEGLQLCLDATRWQHSFTFSFIALQEYLQMPEDSIHTLVMAAEKDAVKRFLSHMHQSWDHLQVETTRVCSNDTTKIISSFLSWYGSSESSIFFLGFSFRSWRDYSSVWHIQQMLPCDMCNRLWMYNRWSVWTNICFCPINLFSQSQASQKELQAMETMTAAFIHKFPRVTPELFVDLSQFLPFMSVSDIMSFPASVIVHDSVWVADE